VLSLDQPHYRLIDDLESHFPHGAPSLVDCERLSVVGDFRFGRNVVIRGDVELVNQSAAPVTVENGVIIER
jgi:UTP--glucose-1-phosphate uridylyltransferase